MSEALPSNYNYPHKNGVVSDEVLHDDRHANPDKYHDDLLPYIDDYLHRKNEQKIDSRLGDEMLAVSTEVLEREEKASVATEFAADALAGVVHRNEQSPAAPQIQSVFKRLDAVVEMGENASYNEVESLRQSARNIARFDVDWYHESGQEIGVYLQKLADFNKQAVHMGGEISSCAIDSLADTIPGGILSRAYKENDAVHAVVDEILNGVEPGRENIPKLTAALSRVYGTMRELNYLVTGQDALVDKLRRRFPVD